MPLISANLITLFPLLLIIALVLVNPIKFNSKCNFLWLLSVTALESFLEIVTVLNKSHTHTAAIISAFANALGFSFGPVVAYLMLTIIMKDTKYEKHKKLLIIPLIFNAFLCFGSIWFDWIFIVTPLNQYYRGPLFLIQYLINIFYIIFFIYIDFTKFKDYMVEDLICRGVGYILVLGSVISQLLLPDLLLIWGTISICLIFYFISLLSMQLRRDPLTMAYNRLCYDNTLMKSVNKEDLTLIIIDLNKFKKVNDTLGHIAGDKLLCSVALTLKNHFNNYGYTYRIGGDEFAIIASHISEIKVSEIFNSIEIKLNSTQKTIGISPLLSYGVCKYNPKIHKDIYAAIKIADNNMYACKQRSRNQYHFMY
ncbi:MAG: GGDEF domain-containing protein [Clostridium sp.]